MNTDCAACGMSVQPHAYHPYAACLMFRACHDGNIVEANLKAVVEHGRLKEPRSGRQSEESITLPKDERTRIRAVLDWMLSDSQCHVWNGWYSQRIADTPEPLKSLVAAEINAYRVSKGVVPL